MFVSLYLKNCKVKTKPHNVVMNTMVILAMFSVFLHRPDRAGLLWPQQRAGRGDVSVCVSKGLEDGGLRAETSLGQEHVSVCV